MSLKPVFCDHPKVSPPKGTYRDSEGRYRLVKGVPPSAVVTAPWCSKDHRPDK